MAKLRDSDMWWSFRRSPLVVAASIVTLLYFVGAVLAPWIHEAIELFGTVRV